MSYWENLEEYNSQRSRVDFLFSTGHLMFMGLGTWGA